MDDVADLWYFFQSRETEEEEGTQDTPWNWSSCEARLTAQSLMVFYSAFAEW